MNFALFWNAHNGRTRRQEGSNGDSEATEERMSDSSPVCNGLHGDGIQDQRRCWLLSGMLEQQFMGACGESDLPARQSRRGCGWNRGGG